MTAVPAQTQACQTNVIHADWLDIPRQVAPASIDFLYADPPFNTGQTQRGRGEAGSEIAFADAFASTADYIAWLEPRVRASLPLLRPTASLVLHIDWRTSHRVRVMLDDLLGEDRFINHLIWHYGLGGSSPRRFARKHDDLLLYCLDPERYYFNPPMVPATSQRMIGQMKKATDVLDIPSINNMAKERVGYPTQKPLALLELLVSACCPPGGTVLDPCCGSGTTLIAARRLGRHAIGLDISPHAVEQTRLRLSNAP